MKHILRKSNEANTILIALLLFVLSISCTDSKKKTSSLTIDDIELNQYQRSVLCPNLYSVHRDVYDNGIQFNFKKYRIPFIKNGKITIEQKSSNLVKTLYFKNSLLTTIKESYQTIDLVYNKERQLIKYEKVDFRYKNGKLSEMETDVSLHTFKEKNQCVNWEIRDKGTDYLHTTLICHDNQNNVVKDSSSYILKGKRITENFLTQYNLDTIISQTYLETKNNKITTHHIISNQRNNSGLLKKRSTEVVNNNVTYHQDFEYEILNIQPLIIKKITLVEERKQREEVFTFNEKKQLTKYEQLGEYGDKYEVIYDEKK